MTTLQRMMVLAAAGCFLATAGSAQAQDQKPSKEEMAAMMEKWKAAAAPTEHHKLLDVLVGTWDLETRTYVSGPGQPPAVSKGSAEYSWLLGGRFLQQHMKSEMMGMPLDGIGLTGYDNFKKKYVFTWIDNSSTAIFTGEGWADKAGTVITSWGKMDEPMTGEANKEVKYVLRIVNKDTHIFEIYDMDVSNDKVVEMVYTRKK